MQRQILSQCRFCGESDNLVSICECHNGFNQGHLDCLIDHVNSTHNPYCTTCGRRFKGIIVKIGGNGFCLWIKSDPTAKCDVFVLPLIVLFFFFIAYLGYIHYITSYWYHSLIFRFFLNHACNIIFLLSLLGSVLVIFKIGADFWRWRRENAIVTTIPLIQEVAEINRPLLFLRDYQSV